MLDVCLNSSAPYYDSCPLIWNQFDDAGYLTAHLEDSFAGGIYHGDALGFKEVIVDFYNRPLIHQGELRKIPNHKNIIVLLFYSKRRINF